MNLIKHGIWKFKFANMGSVIIFRGEFRILSNIYDKAYLWK